MNWREWFDQNAYTIIAERPTMAGSEPVFIEELYHAFKARLVEDLEVRGRTEHDDDIFGHLEERP